ncbi:putative ABC transporter ATP-binding protein [Oxobacter pfennigii]|uniref:Putative ABC transporter ATP-binding protein n=1 Tax=Oxobacter pfennigii TaxID=36849 RepID=A0A0P8W3S8_9CLOT|nr:ABC transporter ATP-binding protein [Oxobacter pfennigii]KPU43247.1 putative ABC transporter ATP-binding protein [Oxobacter pfennigii]
MISMMKAIRKLGDKDSRRLISPIVLSVFDSLLNSCMYGVMLFVLLDLAQGQFQTENLKGYVLVLVTVFLLRCIVQAISFTQAQCLGPDISYRLRITLGNHIRSLNLGYFNKNSIGKLSGTLLTDVNDFETIVTHCLCDFIKVISFTALSMIAAVLINWKFGLAIALLVLIAFPFLRLSGKVSERNYEKLRNANHNVVSRIVEYISGIKTFHLYTLIGSRFRRLDDALQNLRRESIRTEISILPAALSFSSITAMIVPVALILGTWFLTAQHMNAASFLLFVLLAISISSMMTVLSSLYPQVRSISRAADNILSVLGEKPLPYEAEKPDFKNYEISFHDVSFGYTKESSVLHNLSFTARPGTTTALIGPSGSGKTTIISLIARFWDVTEGSITICYEDIRKIMPDTLAHQMAIVFQDVYLLQDTVINNIKIGNPSATKEEIVAAAKAAHCHDFIMEMENGYDTMIGEGGSTLSGGEKQRISIARALLRNAPIVLLDETTSSLDADNEKEIQHAFDHLMKGKTVLVIAHRLKTIINADNILVLDKGHIRESGTHDELMHRNGWYAHMIEEQRKAEQWSVQN